MKQILFRILGLFLSALGLGGCLASIYALIDPSGVQMLGDSNPFGAPGPAAELIMYFVVWAAVFGIGIWLDFRRS